MANYYTEFCTSVKLDPEQIAWAKVFHAVFTGVLEEDPVSDEAFRIIGMTPEDVEGHLSDLMDSIGVKLSQNEDLLVFEDEGGVPNLDYIAFLMQELQKKFDITDVWSFAFANTPSRKMLDSYGGGVVAVSQQSFSIISTDEVLRDEAYRLKLVQHKEVPMSGRAGPDGYPLASPADHASGGDPEAQSPESGFEFSVPEIDIWMDEAQYIRAIDLLSEAAGLFGDGAGGDLGQNPEYERGIIELILRNMGWPVDARDQVRTAIYNIAKGE